MLSTVLSCESNGLVLKRNKKFYLSFSDWQALCSHIFTILIVSPKINLKAEDDRIARKRGESDMNNIFYIIGVVVVVLFVLGYFGMR
jgi:hypothetical protein